MLVHVSPTARMRKLQAILPLSPEAACLTFEAFMTAGVIYVRLSPFRKPFYMSSSELTVFDREVSRRAKFRQLLQEKHAFYESSLRWWRATGTYYEFVAIPVIWQPDKTLVRVQETALISKCRPMLNYPWINPLLKAAHIQAPRYAVPGVDQRCRELGRRACRQHRRFVAKAPYRNGNLDNPDFQNKVCLFGLIYKLGSTTVARFNACRVLLSADTPISMLYLLLRMVKHADEPVRTNARKQLVSLLKKRGGDCPPTACLLKLIPVSASFHEQAKKWLSDFIRHHRSSFPPLHVPRPSLTELRLRSLGKLLFNFRKVLERWHPMESATCVCDFFQQVCPEHIVTVSGHVMAPAYALLANDPLSTASMDDTVWPSHAQFMQHNVEQFVGWLSRWKLPAHLQAYWRTFLQQQWDVQAKQAPLLSSSDVVRVRQAQHVLSGWVLTPADHFPQVLHLCCPSHYHFLLQKTFDDPLVFTPCYNPAMVVLKKIRQSFPNSLKTYTWSLDWTGRLPGAYILPKPSKGYAKARPIITYAGSWSSNLGRMIAACMLIMMVSVFGASSSSSVQNILRTVWMCMKRTPVDQEVIGRQQDLIGFFNTVPHTRIVQDVEYLIHRYCAVQRVTMQVHQNHRERLQRIFQGKYRAKTRQYRQVCIRDLVPLTRFMLAHSFFRRGRQVYRQHLGAAMGSQWSPVVCAVVAATREHMFYSSLLGTVRLGDPFQPFRMVARYVDNRYMVYLPGAEKHPRFSLWTDLQFYSNPILLEEVGSDSLLGFCVDWQHRTITFQQPATLSKLRGARSAGAKRHSIAGFHARALLISRFVRPRHLISEQIADLVLQYLWKGFTLNDFIPLLTTLGKRFQIPSLAHTVASAVASH